MIRIYREHPEFDEFSRFDTQTGRLVSITEAEFTACLPGDIRVDQSQPIQRIEGQNATLFLGETCATHTRFPRRIYFQITRNCNLRCPYCFIKSEAGAPHVPTPAVMEVAAFMGRSGLMEVRLTGGEPTSHPDFFDIVHKFQAEGVYVSVATNGVMPRRTLDRLGEEKNLWVICSIDGNRETHNRYRPGTFDRIIANLKYLKHKNPGTRLRLTTVLTRENQGQMYELGEICKLVDAESITIIPLRPQVREASMKEAMVTAGEFRQVIEDLVDTQAKLGIRFTTTLETDYVNSIYKDPVVRKRSACAAGREATNLDYDARRRVFLVYGCSYSPACDLDAPPRLREPFLAGELPVENVSAFLDVWRDESAWTLFRSSDLKSPECKVCSYLANHQCVGSCPIQNIDYALISADEKVLDQLRQQIERTGEWYCYQKVLHL